MGSHLTDGDKYADRASGTTFFFLILLGYSCDLGNLVYVNLVSGIHKQSV